MTARIGSTPAADGAQRLHRPSMINLLSMSNALPECLESGSPTGEYPVLQHAPIMQALIDMRVNLPADTDLSCLVMFSEPFGDRFTAPKLRQFGAAEIKFGQGANPLISYTGPTPDGYIFTAPRENLIAQARLDGFTLSKLKPYDSWTTFCPQFVELWRRYVAVAKPVKITRVALRYVNRIELPTGRDFQEYILTVPVIAPDIPQMLPAFLMRLVIPSDTGNMAIVTETVGDPSSRPDVFPLIFDIDVFRDVDMDIDDPALWRIIQSLRAYKNAIFFKSLTPATLEMFK